MHMAGAVPGSISRPVSALMYPPRLRSGPNIIFSSAGSESMILRALPLVTSMSVRAFTPIDVLTYDTTVWPGCAFMNSSKSAAGQLSASEQPASASGTSTFLSGHSTLTVSPMKCTPHITTISASAQHSAALLGQSERVAHIVGDVLDSSVDIIMCKDNGVLILLQLQYFTAESLVGTRP